MPLALALSLIGATAAQGRETVDASAPQNLSLTLYRDPQRGVGEAMNRNWPQGFAMITETRQVTLPPGESTIRFTGVAEGMVAVSAIVTGLPGGTIEKNRNADLLSPAALVDGTLGNRVRITRTNPATGVASSEDAIVRTRADGGLVLQTAAGFEAVRCSGLPERLTFDRVPGGLSPQPVFTIDTRDARGGTYAVQLTYLASGFDWQAHYVATLAEPGPGAAMQMRLMSWLTLLNDNGQSFADAELLVVAGTLNVVSDFDELADPPEARPLRLTCYPLGSTADGSAVQPPYPSGPPLPPPPPAPPVAMASPVAERAASIVVTGARMKAAEENLGDLKLYRVPERVTVAAKALKQVAFLDEDRVDGQLLYRASCTPYDGGDDPAQTERLLVTVNDKRHGLGMALPQGGISFFEPAAGSLQLVAEADLRDHATGQDVEVALGTSAQVQAQCAISDPIRGWQRLRESLTNANPVPVNVRLQLGDPAQFALRGLSGARVKDGQRIFEVTVPANGRREITWQVRDSGE